MNADNDSQCVDMGKCLSGDCNPFCEAVQNLQSCACNGKIGQSFVKGVVSCHQATVRPGRASLKWNDHATR